MEPIRPLPLPVALKEHWLKYMEGSLSFAPEGFHICSNCDSAARVLCSSGFVKGKLRITVKCSYCFSDTLLVMDRPYDAFSRWESQLQSFKNKLPGFRWQVQHTEAQCLYCKENEEHIWLAWKVKEKEDLEREAKRESFDFLKLLEEA